MQLAFQLDEAAVLARCHQLIRLDHAAAPREVTVDVAAREFVALAAAERAELG